MMSPQLVLITIVLLPVAIVHCQPDLCTNPKIDGITYVTNLRMYFIISGGYYWYNNTFNFPLGLKRNQAKKLPYGFTGQSVVYLNIVDACSNQNNVQQVASGEKPPLKQQIVVSDLINGENQFIYFDITTQTWSGPVKYGVDKILSQAQIDYTKPIDAMMRFSTYEIFFVQRQLTAGINFMKYCQHPLVPADRYLPGNILDLHTLDPIDALTISSTNGIMLMFQGKEYYEVEVFLRNGKLEARKKSEAKLVQTDFLKFPKECSGAPSPFPPSAEPSSQPASQPSPTSQPQTPQSQKPVEPAQEPEQGRKRGFLLKNLSKWLMVLLGVIGISTLGLVLLAVYNRSKLSKSRRSTTKSVVKEKKVQMTPDGRNVKSVKKSKKSIKRLFRTPSNWSLRSDFSGAGKKKSVKKNRKSVEKTRHSISSMDSITQSSVSGIGNRKASAHYWQSGIKSTSTIPVSKSGTRASSSRWNKGKAITTRAVEKQ